MIEKLKLYQLFKSPKYYAIECCFANLNLMKIEYAMALVSLLFLFIIFNTGMILGIISKNSEYNITTTTDITTTSTLIPTITTNIPPKYSKSHKNNIINMYSWRIKGLNFHCNLIIR